MTETPKVTKETFKLLRVSVDAPQVTQETLLAMQVCVPSSWTDRQVKDFADCARLCGTEVGWIIRKEGHHLLAGDPERAPCDKRPGYVHIVLDA